MTRLAILQNLVAPTRHALFEALAAQPDVELTVLFMSRTEPTRGWRHDEPLAYRHRFLRGAHVALRSGGDVDALHLNPTIVRELRRERFDAVLSAGFVSPTSWLALLAAKRMGTRFLLWYGSSWPPAGARSRLAAPLKRLIVRSSDWVVAYGQTARAQALAFGADPDRTSVALNTTDVLPFASADREDARRHLGLDGPVLLWSGRFVPRKRADLALSLAARLAGRVPGLKVVLAGDGPGRLTAEADARRLGVDARFLGEVPYGGLPEVYAAADLLVTRAEREPWGLVVNEALAAGVPVLASTGVVAARELVPPGAGLVSDSEEELACAGEELLADPAARAAARAVLPRITPEAWAEQVAAAVRAACES